MTENVAWILTRYHNLKQAARILLDESKELDDVGMVDLGHQLLKLSGTVETVCLRLEAIPLRLPDDE